MKTFFGSIFIERTKLAKCGIMHPIKVEYYKLSQEESSVQKEYGINIIKTEYKEEMIDIEEKEIKHLTNDEKMINKVLELFKTNEVTPITARDVLEDLHLCESL